MPHRNLNQMLLPSQVEPALTIRTVRPCPSGSLRFGEPHWGCGTSDVPGEAARESPAIGVVLGWFQQLCDNTCRQVRHDLFQETYIYVFIFFGILFVYLIEREIARAGTQAGGVAEQRAWCGTPRDAGIMTWTEGRSLTDWATHVPLNEISYSLP